MSSEAISPSIEAQLLEAMGRYWGYDSFLPLQAEAMASAMSDRDSVVVLPTGGGKSLCFQAPAVCREGLALVVSPLISLMKDQVDALRACGVAAASINSTLDASQRREVADQIREGTLKLLYVAPERLLMARTLSYLKQVPLSLIAIDEAHCISQWGHDFRPEYRGLRILKETFPEVGIHAYTATATEVVQQDIATQLGLVDPQFLVGSFDRPNLVYRVRRAGQRFATACELIERRRGESGVVYCISRREVDKTAAALANLGFRAVPYHAGLSDDQRHRNQEAFLEERADVVVATVAFGMGIDKSNVRYVIHLGMPKSLEHYVQESGRAGRDGLEADCLLLYSGSDVVTWKRMIEGSEEASEGALESLEAMARFCGGVRCRHRAILEHFGQELQSENCGACDVCLGELDLVEDPLLLAQKILSCVVRLQQRFGADYTAKVLVGSAEQRILQLGHDKLSTYGLLKQSSPSAVRDWIEQLASQGCLVKTGDYGVLEVTEQGRQVLRGEATPKLLKAAPGKRSGRASRSGQDDWEGVDRDLFEQLRTLRSELASEKGVPPYVVFGDTALRDMARRRPASLETFLQVRGVGQRKAADYGQVFLKAISEHCAAAGLALDVELPLGERATPAGSKSTQRATPTASAIAAFDRFRRGASVEEVAAQLGRAPSTVAGYLYQYLQSEKVIDPSPWVSPATASRIEAAYDEVGPGPLKPLYEHLGGEVPYEELRVVLTCLANRHAE